MKVHVLIKHIFEEASYILGVYSTQEAAEDAMFKEDPEEEAVFEYLIEEHELEGGLSQ